MYTHVTLVSEINQSYSLARIYTRGLLNTYYEGHGTMRVNPLGGGGWESRPSSPLVFEGRGLHILGPLLILIAYQKNEPTFFKDH